MNGTDEEQGGLGLWDAVSIIVGIVIGTSIFRVPWLIFGAASDPWMGLTVWAVGGVLALIGALCYAELATTYPKAGGDYFYLTSAFGPWLGFLFGWAQLVVVFTASIGAMAFVFGEYATSFHSLEGYELFEQIKEQLPVGMTSEFAYAALAVVVLTFLNLLGLVFGKTVQNILTLTKVLGLVGIMVAGFGWAQSNPVEWRVAEDKVGWGALAIILVLYAYGGWNDAAFVAAEVRNRRRNIPLALILGVGLITVIYLLVNTAYIVGLGFENVNKFNPTPVPTRLLEKAFPGWGGDAINVLVMISALGAVNGLTLTGARIYPTLGNDYALFGWLGHWKPGKRAPVLALLVQGILTLGMIFVLGTEKGHEWINQLLTFIGFTPDRTWKSGDAFQTLVDHTAPVFWFFFMTTGFSLFLLREKNPSLERPFSVPFYPWLPIIFCCTCIFMLYQSTTYVGWRALFAIGLVVLGVPLFWLAKMLGGYRGEVEDSSGSSLRSFN